MKSQPCKKSAANIQLCSHIVGGENPETKGEQGKAPQKWKLLGMQSSTSLKDALTLAAPIPLLPEGKLLAAEGPSCQWACQPALSIPSTSQLNPQRLWRGGRGAGGGGSVSSRTSLGHPHSGPMSVSEVTAQGPASSAKNLNQPLIGKESEVYSM